MDNKDILNECEKRYAKGDVLLRNIKGLLPDLEKLLEKVSGPSYEDRMYRFYHQSFKVYWLQEFTEEMVNILKSVSPNEKPEPFQPCFDLFFEEIIKEGTGWKHTLDHNEKWTMVARPIVEAFLHCKYFIEMAVKYGKELDEAPNMLPSGWAALLELYNIR